MFLPAFGMLMPGIQKKGDRHAINVVCLPFGVYFSGTNIYLCLYDWCRQKVRHSFFRQD